MKDFDNPFATTPFKISNIYLLNLVLRRLGTICERAKQTLSSATQTGIKMILLLISRLLVPASKNFAKTSSAARLNLSKKSSVLRSGHEIVLVGGSACIPRVVRLLSM